MIHQFSGNVVIRSFDECDFECFGGAEQFAGGQDPIICEYEGRLVIAGGNRVEVMFSDSDADRLVLINDRLTYESALHIVEIAASAPRNVLDTFGFVNG